MNSRSIRLSLDISSELNEVLNEMKNKTGSTIPDVLLKSILLMNIAINEKQLGNQISITRGHHEILKEITGF